MSDPEDDDADIEEQSGDVEEQPDLDDDDMVDVPEEMAAQVAEETTDSDDQDEGDDGSEADDADDQDDDGGSSPLTSGTSVGDVYCNALGMAATMARESKGSGVDDREEQMEEYGDLARQCDLDDFVDEYIETRSGTDQLTPGQGIVVGTMMFGMFVMLDDPDLTDGLAEEVGS